MSMHCEVWVEIDPSATPHVRVRQRITHRAPAHVWGWNPSAIMVAHTHFSVNTTIDIVETHFGAL